MIFDPEKKIIAQDFFDALVDDAIDDLRKSGLPPKDILGIVERHFGEKYAQRFCQTP
jgi:hypothetical protein